MGEQKAYGTVLLRAKSILDELLNYEEGLTLKEISEGVNESKSTTLKVLNTMQLTGMIRRNEDDKRYFIGPTMVAYGEKARKDFNLIQVTKPFLTELQKVTNETINLGIEDNSKVVFLEKLESTQAIHLNSSIGGSMDMYSSSMGKALLANKTDEELKEYFATHQLAALTENTITSVDQLMVQLKEIKKQNFSTEWGENQKEVVCIGASIVKRGVTLGAFSVSVPEYRVDEETFEDIKRLVVSTKNQIEEVL
ncbi:IclR family transcriptional regulator [Pediococcus stilesii]|uniref:IclR family transcriptional regulator n=1 Tax=Pediococcus stilesii TaxID=331679 RepID=A0A0R2KUP2_9LACO|nr:IclR family transcriptional regulator [Pediococcus stilesii]KRN93201.1 IclR family transcriptional regulator [Pediococcus stilesii]